MLVSLAAILASQSDTTSTLPPTITVVSETIPVVAGQLATINPLLNDISLDGGLLSLGTISQPSVGTLVRNGNVLGYTSPAGHNGVVVISYEVLSSTGGYALGSITFDVRAPASASITATGDTAVCTSGNSVTISPLTNDSASDGSTLTLGTVNQPAAGTGSTSKSGNNIIYTAPAGYTGTATFTYTVSSPTAGSATGTVSVQVSAAGTPTITCQPDNASVWAGGSVTISPLANDSASDNSTLTLGTVSAPSAGSVVKSGNNIIYTAPSGFSGSVRITYTVTSSTGGAGSGTVNITVSLPTITTVSDNATATVNGGSITISPLANDSCSDGSALTLGTISTPSVGTAVKSGNNVVYSPPVSGSGVVSITYTVSSASGANGTGTINITLRPATPTITVGSDPRSVRAGQTDTYDPTTNDVASDGSALSVTAIGTLQPGQGTPTRSGNIITYTPPPSFTGIAALSYTVQSTTGASATGSVDYTVSPAVSALRWGPGPKSNFPDHWIGCRLGSFSGFSRSDIETALNRPMDVLDAWVAFQNMPKTVGPGWDWIAGGAGSAATTRSGVLSIGQWPQLWNAANRQQPMKVNIALSTEDQTTKPEKDDNGNIIQPERPEGDNWKLWFDIAAGVYDSYIRALGARMAYLDDVNEVQVGTASSHYTTYGVPRGMRIVIWGWEILHGQRWSTFGWQVTGSAWRGYPVGTRTYAVLDDGLKRLIQAFNAGYRSVANVDCPYYHGTRIAPTKVNSQGLYSLLRNWGDAGLLKCVGLSQHNNKANYFAPRNPAAINPNYSDNNLAGFDSTSGLEGLTAIRELAEAHGWAVWLDESGNHFNGGWLDETKPYPDYWVDGLWKFFKQNPGIAGGWSFYAGETVDGYCTTGLITKSGNKTIASAARWAQAAARWRYIYRRGQMYST